MSHTRTDISPEAVERFSPFAVDGGCDAYGEMEPDENGDFVSLEDYRAQAARIIELEAQLATARNDALDAAAEAGDRENQRRLNLASIRIPALWDELRPVILSLKTETPT